MISPLPRPPPPRPGSRDPAPAGIAPIVVDSDGRSGAWNEGYLACVARPGEMMRTVFHGDPERFRKELTGRHISGRDGRSVWYLPVDGAVVDAMATSG